MARSERPASESYQSVRCSVSQSISYSSEAGIAEDEVDRDPIFSISKSSVDVAMAAGPLRKRDPAWTALDLRRSSSTNTHSKQNSGTLQQLRPQKWQHINPTNHLSLSAQSVDMHSPPALTERWISNMQRWSGCSGSVHSRSSTPDTVICRGASSHPSSLSQEASCNVALDSPMSKITSPPATPSPFISPLHTPTTPPPDVLPTASSTLSVHQPEDLHDSSPAPSPLQTSTMAPSGSNSPDLQLTSSEKECYLENTTLIFQFPSPVPSSVNLAEADMSSSPGCHVEDLIERSPSPRDVQVLEDKVVKSPEPTVSHLTASSPGEGQESREAPSVCNLELPQQSGPVGRNWRSPLVSSLSDSGLGNCCRCNINTREGFAKAPKVEEATMVSQPEMVEVAVQTMSPAGSWWNLKRHLSTSNTGSHSILGSPPGSRLNLRSPVGSHSNLVSPSSSMFPASSGEEEDKQGDDPAQDIVSASSHDLDRRRSCLKIQAEEKDELGGRRSSMKQVQWDENGMTWDIHGAPVDPKVLSTAIRKHLALQNSPKPLRHSSKKKRAPKPPLISKVVTAIAAEMSPSVSNTASNTASVEGKSEGEPEADEERGEEQEVGVKKEEKVEAPRRRSRAEGVKEEEVYREEGNPKSPLRESGHSRKKSVIRSLRRPGWCGSSRKVDD